MTRIAAFVFLVNTFLPILITAALIFAGAEVWRTYQDKLSEPIARIEAQIADAQAQYVLARAQVLETQATLAAQAGEVETAVATATEPFTKMTAAFATIAALKLSKTIKVPTVTNAPVEIGGKTVKVRTIIPWGTRTLTYPKVGTTDLELKLGLPEPVKTAFEDVGTGLDKMLGFVKPMGEMVKALKKLGPNLAPLQAEFAALGSALSNARKAVAEARAAMAPLVNTLRWLALLIVPWILLSYICWVWLRLRGFRRMLAGNV